MSESQNSLMEDARQAVDDALDKCLRGKAYGLEQDQAGDPGCNE